MILSLFALPKCSTLYTVRSCYADVKIHPNAGTTSAAFLKLGLGSRAVGMGESFTGLADDMSALYWNPAGLTQLKKKELHITHNESFEGIRHDFLGYAHLLHNSVFAAALYGITIPNDLERRSGLNENDPFEPYTSDEGTFGAYDLAVHLSYARPVKKNFSGGAGLKIIQQHIDDTSAYGAAIDLGALYTSESRPLSLGLMLQNIGTKITFKNKGYDLPLTLRLGSAWRWSPKFVTTFDLSKPIDNFVFLSAGAEYLPTHFIQIRAGYKYRWYGMELDDLSGLSTGLGINFTVSDIDFRFDYAFSPYGVLGNSQRFSLSSFFGGPAEKKVKPKIIKEKKAKKQKKDATLLVPAQAKPASDYDVFSTTVTTKLKMASGNLAIHNIKIASEKSELFSITGLVRTGAARTLTFEIREKKADGSNPALYKSFSFANSLNVLILKAECKIRVPKYLINPHIVTNDGQKIPFKKNNDGTFTFSMEVLEPFSIQLAPLENNPPKKTK